MSLMIKSVWLLDFNEALGELFRFPGGHVFGWSMHRHGESYVEQGPDIPLRKLESTVIANSPPPPTANVSASVYNVKSLLPVQP